MAPPVHTPSPHRFLRNTSRQPSTQPAPSLARTQPPTLSLAPPNWRAHQLQDRPICTAHVEQIDLPSTSQESIQVETPDPCTHVKIGHLPSYDELNLGSGFNIGLSTTKDDMMESEDFPPATKRRRTVALSPSRSASGAVEKVVVLSSSPVAARLLSVASSITDRDMDHSYIRSPDRVSAAPRFLLPQEQTRSSPAVPQVGEPNTPILKTSRPAFVLPAAALELDLQSRLPTAFSPHRPGEKAFLAGSMASKVRDWILHLELAPEASGLDESNRRRRSVGDRVATVKIAEVVQTDNGVWLSVSITGESWVLVGSEGYGGADFRVVKQNDTVSVKMPWWSVELNSRRWFIAVSWTVSDGQGQSYRRRAQV